jgi:hypothetical protein
VSTEIKPGQVWAWRGGCGSRSAPGVTFEIVEASKGAPDVTYRYQPREGFDSERIFAAPAEDILNAAALLVETVDASGMTHAEIAAEHGGENADFLAPTPASLDLTKVKAGDTATVRVEYTGEDPALPFEVTAEVTERRGQRWVGPVTIDREGGYTTTLIAHQPAPEPEPEWKPGTTGTAEVVREGANGGPRMFRRTRGMVVHRPAPIDDDMFVTTEGEMWGLEGEYCKDFVPDEPRPLPTREQVNAALEPGWGRDSITAMVDAVLALLRGESR